MVRRFGTAIGPIDGRIGEDAGEHTGYAGLRAYGTA
jgi:hypothetical protein